MIADTRPLSTANDWILRELVPFLVATSFNLPHLERTPYGVPIATVIDPLRLESESFLSLLQRLDGLTFGPEGMPMPRWVFFDCAELPGAILGFGRWARDVPPRTRALFQLPVGYDGLVPYSMYVAIPMFRAGHWFGHNLSSLAPVLRQRDPDEPDLAGLGSITKGLALRAFRVERFYGATQWLSKALFIHVKFGPLQLATAYTPAHQEHETLTYAFDVTDNALRASMGDPAVRLARPEPDFWLEGHDVEAMKVLQDRIEAGERFVIPTSPRWEEGRVEVPVTRVG